MYNLYIIYNTKYTICIVYIYIYKIIIYIYMYCIYIYTRIMCTYIMIVTFCFILIQYASNKSLRPYGHHRCPHRPQRPCLRHD